MPLDWKSDKRYSHLSYEQVKHIFDVEHNLREHILGSAPDERQRVFLWAYDELFRQCPFHPALTEDSGVNASHKIERLKRLFTPLLPLQKDGVRILEIGCGMGELLIGLSRQGYSCVGLDISKVRIERLQSLSTDRLSFLHQEGSRLPFSDENFDVVVSMQLFEHLHPDDVMNHLTEVMRELKPGGIYYIETPNRLVGPGDVSRFFSEKPLGFHLREYTIRDMTKLLSERCFTVFVITRWQRIYSANFAGFLERNWELLPISIRRRYSFGLHNPLYKAVKPSQS
jgi:2-polyprenyl-3-methyl-5-hydroxy-6-metoxy-1,4-benzoquinol methylase